MSILEYLLLHYRWIFICFYLLPVSAFCDVFSHIKKWLFFKIYSSPKQHDYKIKCIQKQIQQWIKSGQKVKICTSHFGCQNTGDGKPNSKNTFFNIRVNLLDILEINKDKKTVTLEPSVTIGQLISTLLPLGWTIPVVPATDDDMTVGSLILGGGLNSSSHKYGFFHNTCISYELVLSDGSVVKCSKDENPDLFYAVPWSFGTVGILTEIKIQLLPAHNFVRLECKTYHNELVAVKKFLEQCDNKDNDFVESLMYSDSQWVVVTGQMVDQIEPKKLNEIGKWYKPWFFQHLKSFFIKGCGVEYIPLRDYYHRHTRSVYWELQDIIPFGNNVFFRMFFGWAVPPKLTFFKHTQKELIKKLYKDQPIILDVMVPKENLQLSVDTFDKKLRVYPVWLCPVKLDDSPGFVHSSNSKHDLYVNIGIYGVPKVSGFNSEKSLKEVEQFVKVVKGYKMLNRDNCLSEDEFRQQFDHTLYDQVRNKLQCHKAFPAVFEKINFIKSDGSYYNNLKDW